MYQFSRAIFRDLRTHLETDEARAVVLTAAEEMVERLADGTAPRHPARELFRSVRVHVGLESQLHTLRVIDHYLGIEQALIADRRRQGQDPFGRPLPCAATTRTGTPCARRPVDATGYCPSHRHLGRLVA